MTTDAGPPTKRPADEALDPQPTKTLKTADGAVVPAPGRPHAAPQPPHAPPSTSAPTGQNLAALLVPVPPRWDDAALRAWLASVGVSRIRVARKKRGATLAFLSFGSVADRVAAGAAVAAAQPPPGMKKHARPCVKDDNRRSIVPAADLDVRDVVAPLWRLPYGGQLKQKWGKVQGALLGRLGQGVPPPGEDWAAALTPVGILRSPATRGYRNKCEFSVGPGVGGAAGAAGGATPTTTTTTTTTSSAAAATVGFCLGAFKDGIVEVGSPGPAPNVSPTAIAAADAMSAFLRAGGAGAALPGWDKSASAGFWRLLTVREARTATPMPAPAPGAPPEALLKEALPEPDAPCPAFVDLEWERWLVPARVLQEEGVAAAPAPAPATQPPPPLPPPQEVMLVVQVDPIAADPATASKELAALGEVLVAAVNGVARTAGRPLPTTSLWVQHHSGPSNAAAEDAPLVCLSGGGGGGNGSEADKKGTTAAGCLTDTLAGLRFRVSPSSFFQVNTPAASLLYRAAVAWADPGPGDVVLDVCCGTGTLGVAAARVVVDKRGQAAAAEGTTHHSAAAAADARSPPPPPPRVLGVDITPSAIADATANAAANGLDETACTFVAGRAEDAMGGLLEEATGRSGPGEDGKSGGGEGAAATSAPRHRRLIAIVDPPRAGLHPKVCAALRGCAGIERIVYVSCNVETQAADAARLCGGGGGGGGRGGGSGSGSGGPGGGAPFRPVRSLAVDLFPHTAHVESVLLLER